MKLLTVIILVQIIFTKEGLTSTLEITASVTTNQSKAKDSCNLDCKIPNFLSVLCEPLKPYLHCNNKVKDRLKRVETINTTLQCYCMWRAVFIYGRVHKIVFAKMVEYKPYNTSRKIRMRLSTLGRKCQSFNDYLCDGSIREVQEKLFSKTDEFIFGSSRNDSGFDTAKIYMYEDGWGMLASKPTTEKQPKKAIPAPTRNVQQEAVMWFGMGAAICILLMCAFFLFRLKTDTTVVQPGVRGSLDSDHGMSADRHVKCWDSFRDKLSRQSKEKVAERERLLDHKVYKQAGSSSQLYTLTSTPKNKDTAKKKSDDEASQISLGDETNKATQCGNIDFDVSLTSFSVSTEDTRLKSVTGMPIVESESDTEEIMFHSNLMYGQPDTSSKPGTKKNSVK